MFKGWYILGGRGRFWEDRIVVEKGGIFLERGVDSRMVAYKCLKDGIFWEEGVDSGRIA